MPGVFAEFETSLRRERGKLANTIAKSKTLQGTYTPMQRQHQLAKARQVDAAREKAAPC
jgi:hypothetical protein